MILKSTCLMGIYINKGNEGFRSALNGEYVDKTGMIEIINKTLDTERRYTCVTRSRRFGKTMALKNRPNGKQHSCVIERMKK